MTENEKKRALKMYIDGNSIEQLAAHFDITVNELINEMKTFKIN